MNLSIQKNVELDFNGVILTCPIEEGHRMIPVRTICQIIDVDFKRQDNWLKEHPFFAQLYNLTPTTGADNKQYQMRCLSLFDVDGWLHSIGAKGRKPGSMEKQYAFLAWLREQKLKLYKSIDVFMQENRYELGLIEQKSDLVDQLHTAQDTVKTIKATIKKVDATIADVREKRYTGQTALPFPEN